MKEKHVIILLFLVYLVLRLYFLFTFPPFTDESLYARWGQLMIHNPDFRWASLFYVSRQPLTLWLFGIGSILFHSPLFGARFMMFLLNIPVFFVVWSLTARLYHRRAAIFAVGLLTFTPLFILMQTLAMMDGLLFAISAVILWLFTLRWKETIPVAPIAIGLLLGISLWIKTTAILLVIMSVAGLIWKRITDHVTVRQMIASCIAWIIIPLILLIPLITHPDFSNITHEPGTFVFPIRELLSFPVSYWLRNITSAATSLILYFPVLILSGIFILQSVRDRRHALFSLWFVIPLCITVFLGKLFVLRYCIVGICALLPIFGVGMVNAIERIRWKPLEIVLWGITGACTVWFLVSPPSYYYIFPQFTGERQYALSYTSGYGIPDMVRWIDRAVPSGRTLLLAVPDSPGNPSDYLLGYYYFSPRVHTIFVTLTNEDEFKKIEPIAGKMPVYLAVRGSQLTPAIEKYLTPVVIFQKPYNEDFIGLYQISFPATP